MMWMMWMHDEHGYTTIHVHIIVPWAPAEILIGGGEPNNGPPLGPKRPPHREIRPLI